MQPLTKYIFQYYVRLGLPSETAKVPGFLDSPEFNPLIGIIKFYFNHNELVEQIKKRNFDPNNKLGKYPNFLKVNTPGKYTNLINIIKFEKLSIPLKRYLKKKTKTFSQT